MTTNVVCLQHDAVDGPGLIAAWCARRGYTLTIIREADPLPGADGIDLLILLGGEASALDDTPRQHMERALARAMLAADKPVVGLCLGAQLLAVELGGDVITDAAPEQDWSPIDVENAWLAQLLGTNVPLVFQAHADAIQLPPGAKRLATSSACPVQGFRGPGRALGLQFHIEADASKVAAFRTLRGAPPVREGDADRIAHCSAGLDRLFDDWIDRRA